jgi:hypothetical protein
MNERIKELALAAFQPINDIASEGVADRRTFDQAWFQLYNEKFAELIVSKCSSMLRETAKILQETGSEDEAYILRAHANGLETYFGVKK